jgi:hypothetical protein
MAAETSSAPAASTCVVDWCTAAVVALIAERNFVRSAAAAPIHSGAAITYDI